MSIRAESIMQRLPRSATEPPEERGLARDEVKLMVVKPCEIVHARFLELPDLLEPGDLIVVNTSKTLPAALHGRFRSDAVMVHLASPQPNGKWVIELRKPDRSGPILDAHPGEHIVLSGEGSITIDSPHRGLAGHSRLLEASIEGDASDLMERLGRPIRYGYMESEWPIDAYQTIFAEREGSAEMPSASRPFSDRLVTRLAIRGVRLAPVVLHTGVSSQEAGEGPMAERFEVPKPTAQLIAHTKTEGGRVIAAGTTVARAIESAVDARGEVHAARGWTDLVLGPDRPARVVDGLITGWHEAEASHQDLLRAIGPALPLDAAYEQALVEDYLWHEFGDSALLLP